MSWTTNLDHAFLEVDAWIVGTAFFIAMLVSWGFGRRLRRAEATEDDGPTARLTDSSMAILGLLLAFTFAMSLGRHDQRRQKVVEEANAIGDFYTAASLIKEPHRSELQTTIRKYSAEQFNVLSHYVSISDQRRLDSESQALTTRMTDLVQIAVADGTPIAIVLAQTLNGVTSATASRIASYEEVLPWNIELLLLIAAMVSSFLIGRMRVSGRSPSKIGIWLFVGLVSLVIFVTADLCQPRRGLIRVNRQPLERLLTSIKSPTP